MGSSSPVKTLFYLLPLLSLTLLIQAKLNLDPSDSTALFLFKKDLGLNSQPNHLCNSTGISCEVRTYKNSPVLRVTRIVLASVRLTGSLSPAIGRLSELKELSLPNNQLVGRIPPEIVDCRKLEILNLKNNRFSGKIPPEFSYLVRLRALDLSSNQFSGDLSFLKHFPNLEQLSLADNLFSGKIPVSLKSFRNLRFLNLSRNDGVRGEVASNTMNQVDDSLPKRYMFAENSTKNSTNSTNSNVSGQSPAPSPSQQPSKRHKHKKNIKGWVFGFLVGVVTGILSGFVFSVLFKLLLVCVRGRKKDAGPMIFSSMIKNAEELAFLEREDGVATLQVIGRGGCGEVYKKELENGKLIAIKKIIEPSMDAADINDEDSKALNKKMRQIRSEIQTVGQIRHRNLLPLLAHVSRPDCHYLVYEFMKNGSLQDALQQASAGQRELDWLVRHKIAVGIAEGLEYLHMHHSPRIIHRDLKPGNILLDDDLEARIADFGLAKAIPDYQTHITTSNVAGTVGYIAPEYHQTLKFTDKCDIYSFGMILAVLVTGKLPSDEFFQHTDEMSQVKWLKNVMTSEDPKRAIDPKLMGNGFVEQMLLALKIACFCTLDDPKQRPNSKDIRCMLTQINH